MSKILYIVECKGMKCRIQYQDGYNVHCISCYDRDIDIEIEVMKPNLQHIRDMYCGMFPGCNIHGTDGKGLHCLNCYPDDSDIIHWDSCDCDEKMEKKE
jgi:hypothetical protein